MKKMMLVVLVLVTLGCNDAENEEKAAREKRVQQELWDEENAKCSKPECENICALACYGIAKRRWGDNESALRGSYDLCKMKCGVPH